MSRRSAVFVATVLFLVLPGPWAVADVPVPGHKQVQPRLRFDFDSPAASSGYVFYLKYRRSPGNPHTGDLHVHAVTPGEPVDLAGTGQRFAEMALLAVPRAAAPAGTAPDEAWLAKPPEGTLQAPVEEPYVWRPITDLDEHPVLPYRVTLADGKLQVAGPPDEPATASVQAGGFRVPVLAVGLVASLLIAGTGLWLVRRRLARKPVAQAPGVA
jgi:hypothetical protein